MPLPTDIITAIRNGRLLTDLDMNGKRIVNGDYSNLPSGGGGGGGPGPGTTTAILKGNGSNGFADAIPGTDYATPTALAAKEDASAHATDITAINTQISTINTTLGNKANTADVNTQFNNFAGTGNIVTVGTIATGTWNATAIAAGKLPALNGITAPAADVSLNSHKITSLADPTTGTDGANKQYVDAVATGGVPHPAVAAASTANIASLSGEQTIDGVATSTSRVLVKNQTTQTANGIYVTSSVGWTRATDADAGSEIPGSVFVSGGTVNAGTTWASTSTGVIIGTTNIVYTQTGASTIYSAGAGLNLTGSQFSLAAAPANTLKGNNTGSSAVPADLTVPQSKAMLSLDQVENTALSTWGGSSNITTVGTLSGGSVPVARLSNPAATTAGTNLLSIANPNTISYPRFKDTSNNTDTRTPSQMLGDIGAQASLVIGTGTPMTLTGTPNANTLNMPAATASANGYMTSSQVNTLGAAVPGTRTISTTSPLQISGITPAAGVYTADWSANRALLMPQVNASGQDGYISSVDYVKFSNTTGQVSANNLGGTLTLTVTTPLTTRVILNQVLSSPLTIILPLSSAYGSTAQFPFVEIVDITAAGAQSAIAIGTNAITVKGAGTETVDGGTSYVLPRSQAYLRLNALPTSAGWTTTKYFLDSFRDATDGRKRVTVDVSRQDPTSAAGNLVLAAGYSVTVRPTINPPLDTPPGVIGDIDQYGVPTKVQLHPTDLVPVEKAIGTAGSDVTTSSDTVPAGGTIDAVRIAGRLTGPFQIFWPKASDYSLSEEVVLFDASGTVGPTHPVTITAVNGTDTFNGGPATSFVFDETFGRKVFISDNVGNWSVNITKTALQAFRIINPTGPGGNVFNIVTDGSSGKQNVRFSLLNGQNLLTISNPIDGMAYEAIVVQPASGSPAGTLSLPIGSSVAGNGLGAVTLSTGLGAVDRLRCSYDGGRGAYLWEQPMLNHTSGAVPTGAPASLATSGITSSKVTLTWTYAGSGQSGFSLERATVGVGGYGEIIGTLGASATTYTDNAVTQNTTYNYRIRAWNANGYSGYSNVASATTSAATLADIWEVHFNEGATTPLATQASATVPSGATVDLRYPDWTTSTQNASSPAALSLTPGLAAVTGITVALGPGSTAGTATYSYRVAAWKTSPSGHSIAAAVVYAPANQAPNVLSSANFVRISWSAVTGADYYEVYRSSVTGGSPTTVGRLSPTGPGFTTLTVDDTGLATTGSMPSNISSATDVHNAVAHAAISYIGQDTTSQKLSISFWIKALASFATTGTNTIMTAGQGTASWRINYVSGTKLQADFPGGTSGTERASFSLSSFTTGWHHVVVELDSSTSAHQTGLIVCYIDNVVQTVVTPTVTTKVGAFSFPSSTPIIGDEVANFAIDDVRIFGRLLSAADVNSLFLGNAQ